MRIFYIVVLFLLCNIETYTQDSLAIGEWQSFLPYSTASYVSQSKDKVIYSTKWSLFTVDKEDFSLDFYDKINLLTDVGISMHKYDMDGEQLIVVYNDSNMDLIRGTEVINIPDIKNNSSILGDKQIYNVMINEDGTAFLSCGFGVVQFDLEELEFGFSCFTDVPVYQCTYYGKYIIAATEDGLYAYDSEENNNPSDFQLWKHLGQDNSLPEIYVARDLIEWKGMLYLATENTLYKAEQDLSFEGLHSTDSDSELIFLNKSENNLMLGVSWVYDIGKVLFFDENDNFIQSNNECANRINYAEQDKDGKIWFADKIGDIRYSENMILPCKTININSPFSNNVSDISTEGNKFFIASGGVDPSYTYIYRRDGFFIWDGEKWNNYNENTFPVFQEKGWYDFFRILPHPIDERIFIGTYHKGLLVLDPSDNNMQMYDQNNSTLAGKTGDESRERISGMAFDRENKLWLSNFGAPKPISVLSDDGEWFSLDVNSGKDLRDVSIDQNGYKWFIIDREAEGLLVYDEGADLLDKSDDRQRIISKNNSSLESNKINAIEVDLDGDVWVGTVSGPIVFECGDDVFESGCTGNKRQTVLEGIPAYLLEDVNITCIETDGANRKWFGSENGIFVQSPTGQDQIFHFTKENSRLFDNNIIDMAYNETSGNMFIATEKGVMVYKSATSSGGENHSSNVYAYPNPVRPDYTGPIAIKGFARDSNIKITDIKGQLVHESTSQGGQAVWDGFDYSGRRAASGVYLVFATSNDTFDEPDALVTKLLIMK